MVAKLAMLVCGLFGLAVASGLQPTAAAASSGHAAAAQSSAENGGRTVIELNDEWRFKFGDEPPAVTSANLPDAGWAAVSVPHTWNRVGYYDWQAQPAKIPAERENKAEGAGWYRLSFTPPSRSGGARFWLEFDGASRVADVWLNGEKLGSHAGGFSRFRLDATAAVHPGKSNLLVVRVDNSPPVSSSPTANTFPLAGDFFVYGGLYRPVRLIVTGPAHFAMTDFGGPGVYAKTTSIVGRGAHIAVKARIANQDAEAVNGRVVIKLLDANGKLAARSVAPVELAAGGQAEANITLSVSRARLWQGTSDPYLYTLVAELRGARNILLDAKSQRFGIRQVKIDPERGLFLNGRHTALHGVGLHQDQQDTGWAMSRRDIAERLKTIVDMGANTIRLTHYEHGQEIHELADEYGLVLWDEIPVVTAWTHMDEQADVSPPLLANAEQQLTELIRQNYNHPSVAVWGIANEVDFGPNRPDFLGKPPAHLASPRGMLAALQKLAKQEDPSRSTTLATCCVGNDPTAPAIADVTDAFGANRYFGWYYAKPDALGPHLDKLHATYPDHPLAVTEYGAGGAVSIHTDDPLGGPVDAGGRTQPEEYQTWLHVHTWPILAQRPYLWATWLWNAFDFSSPARHEGDSTDVNTKGLATYDGKIRKDAYYFYRANWSANPSVHINERRYRDRAYGVTDISVFSNAASTDLRINGQRLAPMSNCPQHMCTWRKVALSPGANRIVASAAYPTGFVTDTVEWDLAPAQAGAFRIDAGALVAAPSASGRFGSDAFFEGGRPGTTDQHPRGRPAVLVQIAQTEDRDLLATYREGTFRYSLPLANGTYLVDLAFVSPADNTNERTFDVLANGEPELAGFNPLRAAGGPLRAVHRTFTALVRNGSLELSFVPIKGEAMVSAITVVPQR